MKDSVGQEIAVGDICVHASRHSSSLSLELLRIDEIVDQKRVKGTKREFNWGIGHYEERKSHPIFAENLVLTPLTEFPQQ